LAQALDCQALVAVPAIRQGLVMLLHLQAVSLTSVIKQARCHFRVVHQVGQELHQQQDWRHFQVRKVATAVKVQLVLWDQVLGAVAVVQVLLVETHLVLMVVMEAQVQQIQ
jgi:hypothetical protein